MGEIVQAGPNGGDRSFAFTALEFYPAKPLTALRTSSGSVTRGFVESYAIREALLGLAAEE